jgi:hypothetical protein
MLDTRLYRAAFVPLALAILVTAFALGERPRPIGTTLAPDAFDGRRAFATLRELAAAFPEGRPGSPADEALAERVERDLRAAGFAVRVSSATAETIDGDEALTTVIGERPGLDSRRLVIVTQRDRVGAGDAAGLSATAALLELARLYEGRPVRRTLTLVSTSGGTGGMAGVRDLARRLDGPVEAVIVVGDIAGRTMRRPFVIPWSEDGGMAPLQLRRTVEDALRLETERDPGQPRALTQVARLAVPMSLTAQGPLGAAGLSAVTVQVSGERGPAGRAAGEVSQATLQAFGRGLLRAISALDNGPAIRSGPRDYVVVGRRVLPRWAVTVIAGLLLLPAIVGAVDGLARVRRRRQRVAVWLRWLAAAAIPFAAVALLARLLALVGVVPDLEGPVLPSAVPPETAPVVAVGLVLVGGLAARGLLARRLGAPSLPQPEEVPGAGVAVALAACVLALLVLLVNPYAALLLVVAVHVWLLAVAPEVRLPRPVLAAAVIASLLPFALVGVHYASLLGIGAGEAPWTALLLVAGGTIGLPGVLVWSAIAGCWTGALLVVARKRARPEAPRPEPAVRIRGPLTYAGPGSLGGTESAIRR